MKLSKQFTTITPLSKFLALLLFILLPLVTFFLGTFYEQILLLPFTVQRQKSTVIMTTPVLSPEEVTTRFYESYLSCLKSSNYWFPEERCGHGDDTYVTSDFLTSISKSVNGQTVRGDPVLCSQNIPSSIRVESGSNEGNRSSVIVREQFNIENIVHVALKLQNSTWKIDTVTCSQWIKKKANFTESARRLLKVFLDEDLQNIYSHEAGIWED